MLFQENLVKKGALKDYAKGVIIAIPPSYYYSGKAEVKARRGIPITGVEDVIRKHPFIVAGITGLGATRLLTKAKKGPKFMQRIKDKWKGLGGTTKISSVVGRLDSESLDQIYNELITLED